MTTPEPSRRTFLAGSLGAIAGAVAARPAAAAAGVTAGEIIDRIKANVGVAWRAQTVDNVIHGSPDTPVTGVGVTMMATLDALQRAAAAGKNMVITHEPTFFSHQDDTSQLQQDPVYRFKVDFLQKNRMVVFHFHDHWHGRRPDGIHAGMARELGWEKNASAKEPRVYDFPGTPLGRLAGDIRTKLRVKTLRVVGDPALPVRRVMVSWGYVSQFPGIPQLARPDVDVMALGETREWELVEYAQDAAAAGKKKGLIIVGHVASEQAGMKYCAEWLRGFVSEVPVEYLEAPEPFWLPA